MTLPALRLTVAFHDDESPMSFVSRLAVRNGTTARRLCTDFGLRFAAVAAGKTETLREIAALGCVELERLSANAFVATGRNWIFRGQVLDRSVLQRARLAICPACALADIENAPELRPEVAVYGRYAWLIDPIRNCAVHRMPIVVSERSSTDRLHDFTHGAAKFLSCPGTIGSYARRDPSALELYLLGRLAGRTASPLFDPMPFVAVVRICETAGAVALYGPKVNLRTLSGDEREAAGGRGYSDLAGGEESIRTFIDGLIDRVGSRTRLDGPKVALGGFYTLLNGICDDQVFDELSRIVRDHIVERFAIDHGRKILGGAVQERRVHTLYSLASEFEMHPARLRRHLATAGLLSERQIGMSDHNVRMDAARAVEVVREVTGTLTLLDAIKHFNAPASQMKPLIRAGIIVPSKRISGHGARKRYAVAHLDDIIERMYGRVRRRRQSDCDIPTAAGRACISAAVVVRLILDGKLQTAGGQKRGYLGVLVDSIALRNAVRGPKLDGLSLRKTARKIGVSDQVLDALIAHGHIASFRSINPVNRCPQTIVSHVEIGRFKANYVSLWRLSKERGIHIATMKTRLEQAGVEPAFAPEAIGARFYRVVDTKRS